jgi:hypothetical protein
MSDEKAQTPPDRLSVNHRSPHFAQDALERGRVDPRTGR